LSRRPVENKPRGGWNYSIKMDLEGVGWKGVDGIYRGADKSLARPGRKQATGTEGFEFHISYL
jgi:hypothetical protein